MSTNLDKFKEDIERLVERGEELLKDLSTEKLQGKTRIIAEVFRNGYEHWYSESLAVVRQLLPDRLDDFTGFYKRDKRKSLDYESYTISDRLIGLVLPRRSHSDTDASFHTHTAAWVKFHQQILILRSARARFESTLFDIRQLVLADMLDSEIAEARELAKKGFLRAAGAVVGVGLEKHLAQVCQNHSVTIRKKNPTIADFNESLKSAGVVEIPDWRFIQRPGDLRNLCDHNKDREPTKEEINELVDGVDKIIKTLF